MKKIFNYALLAAALLVGVNVNAQNNCTVQIGEGQPQAANFVDVLTNINGADYINQSVVITLSEDISITNPNLKYDQVGNEINANGSKYYDFSIFPGADNTIDVTIDLNGKSLQSAPGSFFRIRIFKGKLTFTGKGTIKENIQRTDANAANYGGGWISAVAGTAEDVSETYAELVIDKDVTLISELSYGVGLFYASYGSALTGETKNNVSNGAVLTIKGTIQANSPVATNGTMSYMTATNRPDGQFIQAKKYPVVNIESTAILIGDHSEDPLDGNAGRPKLSGTVTVNVLDQDGKPVLKEDGTYKTENKTYESLINAAGYPDATQYLSSSTCVYAPGYAIYNIKGRIEGGIGIYAKAGKLNIDGAVIKAVSEHYYKPIAFGNGCIGSGSALVLDSHAGYGQFDGASIANSTLSSDNGFAIEETATTGGDKLPVIEVESGTFVGGKGAITTTDEEKGEIINRGDITGGEWHNSNVDQYIDKDNYTTLDFVDGDGKHYQIVVPIRDSDWSTTIAVAATKAEGLKYAKVIANEDVTTDTKVEFVRIQGDAVVTVKAGKTLDAGTLMTEGGNSKIIVEAGGKLIVSGKQGAYTYDENSLVVKASQTTSGQILINPAVVLNTTPKATVEFVSGSYYKDNIYVFQFFGAPMLAGKVSSVTTTGSANCAMQVNRGGSNWESIGTILSGVNTIDVTKFDVPFGFYSIQSKNDKENLQTYVFQGNLYGNTSPNIDFEQGWPGFSNAYMANTNVSAFFDVLFYQTEDPSIYTYEQVGKDKLVWTANNPLEWSVTDLKPMNAFMLRNTNAKQQLALDYTAMVWNPAMGIEPNNAPRLSHIEKASIFVKDANGVYDKLTIAQDDQFSAAYDKGFDAEKFMNAELNIYVKGEKNLAIAATDNLENTYVGFNCNNAGKYALSFENVTGNFALLDTKTNACIAMNEGSTYEFIANAGEDAYRFMIVRGAQAPTEMQKTNAAVKANKALINGQIVISNGERFFNVLGNEVK